MAGSIVEQVLPIADLNLALIEHGSLLELRKDTSIPGRTIFGWAIAGTSQNTGGWLIYAEDVIGSSFHRQFAEVASVAKVEFVHQWANRLSIIPGKAFLNEFSVQFNGVSNEYALVPDASDIDFDRLDAFTMQVRVKTIKAGTLVLMHKAVTSAGNQGYLFQIDGSGRVEFKLRNSGTNEIHLRTDAFTDGKDGSWHHYMITKRSGTSVANDITIYVDGISHKPSGQGGEEDVNVLDDSLTNTTSNTNDLGVAANGSGGARLTGNLDSVAIWSLDLTDSENNEIVNNNQGAIDLQAGTGQISSALVSWWRMGDGSFVGIPTVPDEEGANTMTLQSAVTSGDIESEVAP